MLKTTFQWKIPKWKTNKVAIFSIDDLIFLVNHMIKKAGNMIRVKTLTMEMVCELVWHLITQQILAVLLRKLNT